MLKKRVIASRVGTNASEHLQYGGSQNTILKKDIHGQKTLQTTLVMPNHLALLPY
jgi:hypothetical protein